MKAVSIIYGSAQQGQAAGLSRAGPSKAEAAGPGPALLKSQLNPTDSGRNPQEILDLSLQVLTIFGKDLVLLGGCGVTSQDRR